MSSSVQLRSHTIFCQPNEGAQFAKATIKKNKTPKRVINVILSELDKATIQIEKAQSVNERTSAYTLLRKAIGSVNWLDKKLIQAFINRLHSLRESTNEKDEKMKGALRKIFAQSISGINKTVTAEIELWKQSATQQLATGLVQKIQSDDTIETVREMHGKEISLLEKYLAQLAKADERMPETFEVVKKIGLSFTFHPLYQILQQSEIVPKAVKFYLGACVAWDQESKNGSDGNGGKDAIKQYHDKYLSLLSPPQLVMFINSGSLKGQLLKIFSKTKNQKVRDQFFAHFKFYEFFDKGKVGEKFILRLQKDIKKYCQTHTCDPLTCSFPQAIQTRLDLVKKTAAKLQELDKFCDFLEYSTPITMPCPPSDPFYCILLHAYQEQEQAPIPAVLKWCTNNSDATSVLSCLAHIHNEHANLWICEFIAKRLINFFRINYLDVLLFTEEHLLKNKEAFISIFKDKLTLKEVEEHLSSLCKSIEAQKGKAISKEIKRAIQLLIENVLPLKAKDETLVSKKSLEYLSEIEKNKPLFIQVFGKESNDRHQKVQDVLKTMHEYLEKADITFVQKAALSNQAQHAILTNQIHSYPFFVVDELRKQLKSLPLGQLKKIYEPVLEAIKNLQTASKMHFTPQTLSFSGQDSLNRELLISRGWNDALHDPKVILGLFALEKATEYEKALAQYNEVFSDRTLTQMIALGLQVHPPALLEVLPLNKKMGSGKRSELIQGYMQRKDIQHTFLPILQAISMAYKQLTGIFPPPSPTKSVFDKPYDVTEWGRYEEYLSAILKAVDSKNEAELFTLQATEYTPQDLKRQTVTGFERLLSVIGIQSKQETLESLVEHIATSDALLDPVVSHLFYDRLHLLVALKCKLLICLKGGKNCTIRDVIVNVAASFARKGVSAENAIAAEQFFFRILFLADKLKVAHQVKDQQALIEHNEAALISDPKNNALRKGLAKQYMEVGNFIAALALLQRAQKQQAASLELDIQVCQEKLQLQMDALFKRAKECGLDHFINARIVAQFQGEKDLLPIEAAALRFYTSKCYKIINLYLRKEFGKLQVLYQDKESRMFSRNQQEIIALIKEIVPIIIRAIEKLPSLASLHPSSSKEDVNGRFVFRGLRLPVEKVEEWQRMASEKKPLTSFAFTSATSKASESLIFSTLENKNEPLFCIIEAQSGVKIEKYSEQQKEMEVLFAPHSKFQIMEMTKISAETDADKVGAELRKLVGKKQSLKHFWVIKMKEQVE